MSKTPLNQSISMLGLLRFSLSIINFIIINYYASNKYIWKFSNENKAYLSIFEKPTKFNDIFQFYGSRYEDIKYQSQYLMDPKKYHNYYVVNNRTSAYAINCDNRKIGDTWDARQLNYLSPAGYVRHQIARDIIYFLLDLKQDEKTKIDRMLNYEVRDTYSLSKKNTVIDYIISVSESKNYQIYFWVLGEKEVLLPHPQTKQYEVCSSSYESTHWRFDLMISNITQFELIEIIGFKKGVSTTEVQPFVDTLSYGRLIFYAYLEFFLNLPLVLVGFMLSIFIFNFCAYTTSLALSSQSFFRDMILNVILCFFIWSVYEFQLNFDANMIAVSQKLSHQNNGPSFCTLPLLFETHFYLKMTQLAFLITIIPFFANMMLPKKNFLEAFCMISATLLVFSGVQLYQIASEFENSCAYNFYDALYCTAISNFFILSSHSLKLSLFNGSFLKFTGQALSITQICMNNFVFFNKKNFEHINSENDDNFKEINQENTNQTPLM